jgi:Glycosyl transferase family 2
MREVVVRVVEDQQPARLEQLDGAQHGGVPILAVDEDVVERPPSELGLDPDVGGAVLGRVAFAFDQKEFGVRHTRRRETGPGGTCPVRVCLDRGHVQGSAGEPQRAPSRPEFEADVALSEQRIEKTGRVAGDPRIVGVQAARDRRRRSVDHVPRGRVKLDWAVERKRLPRVAAVPPGGCERLDAHGASARRSTGPTYQHPAAVPVACRYPARGRGSRPADRFMAPLVSVLTPSLNQARYLGDCLGSVATQTYAEIEHVVWDGGSTDGSVGLLRSAGPGVRWTSERDDGQSDALNRAFAMSSGEIVGWLNSDDGYADRRAVEWAVGHFAAHPDVDVLYGETLLVNEDNVVLQVRAAPAFSLRLLRVVHYVIQPSLFLRRTALERLDTFVRNDLRFVMDRDLVLRLGVSARVEPLRRVVAFDRHQRERKVLQPAFLEERRAYNDALGPEPPAAAALAASVRIWTRLAAAPTAARLPTTLDPAIELRLPGLPTRLAWQLVYKRRRLPFGRVSAAESRRS